MTKRIFFSGDIHTNAGPSNVNKLIKKYLEKDSKTINVKIAFLKSKNLVLKQIEVIYKTVFADYIIYSGTLHVNIFSTLISKILKKTNIYLMHGCIEYESKINNSPNQMGEKIEKIHMEIADKILCVSENYSDWTKKRYPKYEGKIDFLTNAIDWDVLNNIKNSKQERYKNIIVLMGGGRVTKKNINVCRAVDLINDEFGMNLEVYVLGRSHSGDDYKLIEECKCSKMVGLVSHSEVLDYLKKAHLYIQNSLFEPFGLAVVEALLCGCNILVSKNVGAISVIDKIKKEEIIENCEDINEIKEKIMWAINNSNNKRLLESIDRYKTSGEYSAKKIIEIINMIGD